MATEKDLALLDFLLKGTDSGEIRWEPTAADSEFTTSLKGKYNITVGRSRRPDYSYLKMVDADNRELLLITSEESVFVGQLFDMAKRQSLNVDAAIDEILGNR